MYDYELSTLYVPSSNSNFCSLSLFGSALFDSESGESEQEDVEDGDSSEVDSISVDDILTNTDILIAQNESISGQIDNLNENLITLHNDIKIGIGFGFVLMVYIMIKCAFGIFNKVFSSDKW